MTTAQTILSQCLQFPQRKAFDTWRKVVRHDAIAKVVDQLQVSLSPQHSLSSSIP
jgi:hypothetical protein